MSHIDEKKMPKKKKNKLIMRLCDCVLYITPIQSKQLCMTHVVPSACRLCQPGHNCINNGSNTPTQLREV